MLLSCSGASSFITPQWSKKESRKKKHTHLSISVVITVKLQEKLSFPQNVKKELVKCVRLSVHFTQYTVECIHLSFKISDSVRNLVSFIVVALTLDSNDADRLLTSTGKHKVACSIAAKMDAYWINAGLCPARWMFIVRHIAQTTSDKSEHLFVVFSKTAAACVWRV